MTDEQRSEDSKVPAQNISEVWGALSSLLRKRCTASLVRKLVRATGIGMSSLPSFVDMPRTSEYDELMLALDQIFYDMSPNKQRRFLLIIAEDLPEEKPELADKLEKYLRRIGWKVHEGTIVPVDVFDVAELPLLPEQAHTDLVKAAERVRDGDLTGAITAACGAVDSTTSKAYSAYDLGNHRHASFQERVVKSLRASGAYKAFENELVELGWLPDDAQMLAKNVKSALNHGAYVLQKIRSDMSDVHGSHPTIEAVVYDSVKWAAIIVRLLRSVEHAPSGLRHK